MPLRVVSSKADKGAAQDRPAGCILNEGGNMKFFIDTADIDEIKEAMSWGCLAGVTTNPSLYARTGGKLADFEDHMVKIAEICEGLPLSLIHI